MLCWYCECIQIKVDLLQFQMMFYSYLYDQNDKTFQVLSLLSGKNASDLSSCCFDTYNSSVNIKLLKELQYEFHFVVYFLDLITWKVM